MFLNEHTALLRDWYAEDDDVAKPQLDEYDLQLIQEEIELALKRRCKVRIKTWRDKRFHYQGGTIESIDVQSRTLVYDDPYGPHRLPIDEIVAIRQLD